MKFSEKNLGEESGMSETLRVVLENAKKCHSSKKVNKDKVRLMSRERMERSDKTGKMKSLYQDRPWTGKSGFSRK